MTKKFIGFLAFVVVVGGAFLAWKISRNTPISPAPQTANAAAKPWVEVLLPKVIVLTPDGNSHELKTGDEVEVGSVVSTAAGAKANIYFPSGSVARLDSATQLRIDAADMDNAANTLSVKLKLLSGRVWSKIATLANFQTAWEVKTTNAVAVVRGTAFSMEYKNGISRILGVEHTVSVTALDTKTGEPLAEKAKDVAPNKLVEISDVDAHNIKDGVKNLEVKDAPKSVREDVWVKNNESSDGDLEQKLNQIEEKHAQTSDAQKPQLPSISEELKQTKLSEPVSSPSDNDTAKPTPSIGSSGGSGQPSTATGLKGTELILSTKADTNNITEGDKIVFTATLKMSDGSQKDVTSAVNWRVLGQIGNMPAKGVFVAQLDPALGDVGQGSGAVIATWQGPNGENLLGKAVLTVIPALPAEPLDTTGQ